MSGPAGTVRWFLGAAYALGEAVRSTEWWEFKLAPLLASAYATTLFLGVPLSAVWPALVIGVLALVPGAAWVSLMNDLADRHEDRSAGKPDRVSGHSPRFFVAAFALTLGPGALFAWTWRNDPLLLAAYGGAWLSFILYSLPPFRLKARGFAGVLADAAGANLFPQAVLSLLVFRAGAQPVDAGWLLVTSVLATCYGLRGILWHQATDVASDRATGVSTFAARHGVALVGRVGAALLPAEIAALACVLWGAGSPLAAALLVAYLAFAALRRARWGMTLVVVLPTRYYRIALSEYYELFLPLGLLLQCVARHPPDLLVLAVHLLLFHRRAVVIAHELRTLARREVPAEATTTG